MLQTVLYCADITNLICRLLDMLICIVLNMFLCVYTVLEFFFCLLVPNNSNKMCQNVTNVTKYSIKYLKIVLRICKQYIYFVSMNLKQTN